MRRFSPALLSLLALLLVGGLVLAFVAKRLWAREAVVAVDNRELIPMALQDIEPGTVITASHIGRGPINASKLEREHIKTNDAVVGRIAKNRIKAVQPISTIDLYAPGEFPALDIAPGMRAVSVNLGDGAATVDGIVRPGDHVDVLFTPAGFPDIEGSGGMVMTLFKGVKVAGLNRNRLVNTSGTNATRVNRGTNTVTLELSPEQANILVLAKGKGELNLTYTQDGKGTGEIALKDKDRATFREILGLKEPEKPTPPHVTELYSGQGRRLQLFKDGLRLDRYGIERADYHRNGYGSNWGAGYGNGGYGGYGGGGYGGYGGNSAHPTDTEPNGDRSNYGGGGNGGFGNGTGMFSVPGPSVQGPAAPPEGNSLNNL